MLHMTPLLVAGGEYERDTKKLPSLYKEGYADRRGWSAH